MNSFPVKVIDPINKVVDTFYVAPPAKIIDALKASGRTGLNTGEEVFLNGKPVSLNEDLIPGDTVEVSKKETPVVIVLPQQAGG